MKVRVQCPRCGRRLLAREGVVGSRATCPACLAEVAVPDTVQAARPEPRESGPSCPQCGRDVEAAWVTCPWCSEPLSGWQPRPYGRPDIDVRRDQKGTSGALVALAVVGGIGVVAMFLFALTLFGPYDGGPGCMIALVLGLLLLGGVVLLVVWRRSGGAASGGQILGRAVVRTLAVVGALAAALLATAVFLAVVCATAAFGPR